MPIQAQWPISLQTPLGTDVLLPESFTAAEGISQMFRVTIEALSEHPAQVLFANILGQPVTVEVKMAGGAERYWNGIVNRITQGDKTTDNVHYTLEVVPKVWLLTRVARSRIFQQKSAP